MFLKPKSTVMNPRALVYKRFTQINTSTVNPTYYVVVDGAQYANFYVFDVNTESFLLAGDTEEFAVATINSPRVVLTPADTYLQYKDKYYTATRQGEIVQVSGTTGTQAQLLSVKFGSTAKYQTNKYYYAGSFDYTVRGASEGSTTQTIKGMITPLTSFNIKYFNDAVDLKPDDLVVIGKHLYSVESPEKEHKHMPKDYYVYFATLNSVL